MEPINGEPLWEDTHSETAPTRRNKGMEPPAPTRPSKLPVRRLEIGDSSQGSQITQGTQGTKRKRTTAETQSSAPEKAPKVPKAPKAPAPPTAPPKSKAAPTAPPKTKATPTAPPKTKAKAPIKIVRMSPRKHNTTTPMIERLASSSRLGAKWSTNIHKTAAASGTSTSRNNTNSMTFGLKTKPDGYVCKWF
ncbi:hypothetical protein FRX31_009446 [Thalictrum thalictroides]|uniref:Uncharacterized protein n=1 Tax=Thalictrum thalictroides TaxID=46969 RepID=A0A7J6WVN0_THATH|nr:hypothetical protein FRX31_009446 [Thalictrum thalictroides]